MALSQDPQPYPSIDRRSRGEYDGGRKRNPNRATGKPPSSEMGGPFRGKVFAVNSSALWPRRFNTRRYSNARVCEKNSGKACSESSEIVDSAA